MALYVISDLHLSTDGQKPMSIFGKDWENHDIKIKENWNSEVEENDTVIIGGDISWGMKGDDAKDDLLFIQNELKGKKILLKGNHDYWWSSVTKLNDTYDMQFLQNTSVKVENRIIVGTRGWLTPSDKNFKKDKDTNIYKRELLRLELSINDGLKNKTATDEMIGVLHFPPTSENENTSGFTQLFEKYNIKKVYYGHLHTKEGFTRSILGEHGGIEYFLTSADYIKFSPLKIY